MTWDVRHGDCLDGMRGLDANSVDAIVTDPPYGLSFMGKDWDHGVPGEAFWTEALRVAKPGAHLLAFGGTRTFHRLACAIEDAGWEIRDCLSWLYGSGFPKSRDIGKDFDKGLRPVIGTQEAPGHAKANVEQGAQSRTHTTFPRYSADPVTNLAQQWQGWGTALKPAWEPVIMARKPLIGTVAANVAAHGTGGLNVDGCRIEVDPVADASQLRTMTRNRRETADGWGLSTVHGDTPQVVRPEGRWPANVCLDEDAAAMLDAQSGERASTGKPGRPAKPCKVVPKPGMFESFGDKQGPLYSDTGGASRFFFVAKESSCEKSDPSASNAGSRCDSCGTAIAPNDAATSESHGAMPPDPSPHGPLFTPDSANFIPRLGRAPSVEGPDSTDTTPTTPTCCVSCGCALPATDASTRPASGARVEAVSVRVSGTRFLYSAKASRSEREAGLEGMPRKVGTAYSNGAGLSTGGKSSRQTPHKHEPTANHHPTVKPLALMRWLCRLVTPAGGLVLDPFTGSGTTGCAAALEGFRFLGFEREAEYVEIARRRIAHHAATLQPELSA